jgi:hypothetical protein
VAVAVLLGPGESGVPWAPKPGLVVDVAPALGDRVDISTLGDGSAVDGAIVVVGSSPSTVAALSAPSVGCREVGVAVKVGTMPGGDVGATAAAAVA